MSNGLVIMRHHPTACNYTINRFAIFKGVK